MASMPTFGAHDDAGDSPVDDAQVHDRGLDSELDVCFLRRRQVRVDQSFAAPDATDRQSAPEPQPAAGAVRLAFGHEPPPDTLALHPLGSVTRLGHEEVGQHGIRPVAGNTAHVRGEVVARVGAELDVVHRLVDEGRKFSRSAVGEAVCACGEPAVAADPLLRTLLEHEDACALLSRR